MHCSEIFLNFKLGLYCYTSPRVVTLLFVCNINQNLKSG